MTLENSWSIRTTHGCISFLSQDTEVSSKREPGKKFQQAAVISFSHRPVAQVRGMYGLVCALAVSLLSLVQLCHPLGSHCWEIGSINSTFKP